jgi:hypothetical protein
MARSKAAGRDWLERVEIGPVPVKSQQGFSDGASPDRVLVRRSTHFGGSGRR